MSSGERQTVTDGTIQKPTRTDRARERLEKAVVRMETALDGRIEASAEKNTALAAELVTVQSENIVLREANEAVSQRLDAAIERLKTVLGG